MPNALQHTVYRQFSVPLWWPLCLRLGGRFGFAYLILPFGLAISWNMPLEPEERTVWQAGHLLLSRNETAAEEEDRILEEEIAREEADYENQIADYYSY